ncbi:NADAR family protein [Microbispora sp. NBC_01389]|uniref:NADAR family protein n=1 Tax=Microbispora sp. NBC_01389 TaxID=2903584 RepID=UPI00324D88D5
MVLRPHPAERREVRSDHHARLLLIPLPRCGGGATPPQRRAQVDGGDGNKAWLFGDDQTAERVLAAGHPNEAKTLGRTVRDFDEQVWNAQRFGIVVRGSLAKFGQNADLRRFLLATTGRVLVEASPNDRIWGIGLTAGDERAASPATWQGLNLLGFALMIAREILAADP